MTLLENPSKYGQCKYNRIVYCDPNLNFLKTKDLQDHCVFDNPTPGYETQTINFSEVMNFDYSSDWPFGKKNTPINGIFCLPDGQGPFPVAVIVHGNSNYKFNSAPGFLYLCDLLASHGIIATSIDVSFISNREGINSGKNGLVLGRTIAVLEHLKQFRLWNEKEGHPLHNKVDLERCLIIGHSFGGEAVGHASVLNRQQSPIQFYKNKSSVDITGSNGGLGPYNFGIKGVIAIAPSVQSYGFPEFETRVSDNYLIIQASRDKSVEPSEGNVTYDGSHPVNSNDKIPSGLKALLWIYKANHNYFNSVWEAELSSIRGIIDQQKQRRISSTYISAFAKAMLLEQREYLKLLQDHQFGINNRWLPNEITYVSQYQSPNRLLIQHFEESGIHPRISWPNKGSVMANNIIIQVQPFFRLKRLANSFFTVVIKDLNYHLCQETNGIRIDWTELGGEYILHFEPSLNTKDFEFLSFRVGQSFEPNNTPDTKQDFTVVIHYKNTQVSLPVSWFQAIHYPDVFDDDDKDDEPVTVLQTVFIPLEKISSQGIDTSQLTRLEFLFDITPSGTLYIDDIQLTSLV